MRSFFLALLWGCLGWEAWAAPKTPITRDQELAQQATTLEQQANQETNATRAHKLRQEACATWEMAYEASQKPEYQLDIGLCKQELPDLMGAEVALRVFLGQVPPTHPNRPLAEEAVAQLAAQRKAEADAKPQALTFNQAIPVQDSPEQRKRKTWLVVGGVGGLGLAGGLIAIGVVRSQQENLPRIPPTELEKY